VSILRGRVYGATLNERFGEKPYLVVSNNHRNAALGSVLAVRVTGSAKPQLPSIVELSAADPLGGRALCDEITEVYRDEVGKDWGAVSADTMRRVEDGIRAALSL
jgi:mRNA interferase MazF